MVKFLLMRHRDYTAKHLSVESEHLDGGLACNHVGTHATRPT